MAHHKSAKKRIKVTARRTAENKIANSKIKTLVKKVLNNDEKAEVEAAYKQAVSAIDKNVTKGRLHKNTAARKKSALTRHLNSLGSAAAEKA
ncbi:MAG: 30S ribosomal protein S20 [Syntrophothermus sp.]